MLSWEGDCRLKCYIHDDCMSINVGKLEEGQYLCNLSNSDHEIHPEDLKMENGYVYTAVTVIFLLKLLREKLFFVFVLFNTMIFGPDH